MSKQEKSLAEINEEAIQVLFRALGVVDATRFLSQFSIDSRVGASERSHPHTDATLSELVDQVKQTQIPEQQSSGKERLDAIKKKHVRAYERWSEDEDEELRFLFSRDTSVRDLAAHFGLQPSAIRSRLRKLNLVSTE